MAVLGTTQHSSWRVYIHSKKQVLMIRKDKIEEVIVEQRKVSLHYTLKRTQEFKSEYEQEKKNTKKNFIK